jgi:subtilisin family serine protease
MRRRLIAASAALTLLGALSGAPTAASAAPALPSVAPVKAQQYLVATTSAAAAGGVAVQVGKRGGGQVTKVYSRVFRGFSAELSTAQAQALRTSGDVESVTLDGVVRSTGSQAKPPWGLDRIDQRPTAGNKSYRYETTGAGVTAFVIDTGIRASHKQFGGRASSGYDFVDKDRLASDCQGHGTHVAGTIGGSTYGVSKRVKIVALRVLDCEGSGQVSDILAALDWVVAHKPAGPSVVNLSLGGLPNKALDGAVERTVKAGIPVVVAAGNEGEDACKSSPARAPHAITVAATDSRDTRATWSNFGRCVDIFAPGVDVRSAWPTSKTATEVLSGTSMATPHVTGVLARYLQVHPKATPAQASKAVLAAGTGATVQGRKGAPNLLLYVKAELAPTPTRVVPRRGQAPRTSAVPSASLS